MTKIELPCSVITDLLPLYQDGLCSPESKELIEAHLETCENCRRLSSEIPLPEAENAAVPDEAEAFRRLRKKTRRGKLIKVMSICASVLLTAFLVLNCIWIPVKYIPYKKLCRDFGGNPDGGKGTQYVLHSDGYIFHVKMPGYLGFEGGFLSVEPVSQQTDHSAFEPIVRGSDMRTADPEEAEQTVIEAEPGTLFIWPQISGETEFGVMIVQQQTANRASFSQFYISKDLEYLDEKNTLPDDTPERKQQNHALYEAHLDEVRGLMDAAKKQWPELFADS